MRRAPRPHAAAPINFMIGNHSPFVVTEDIFEYVVHGLRHVGKSAQYSIAGYGAQSINLLMEGINEEYARNLVESRRRHPESRFYLIATEVLGPNGFNSANTVHSLSGDHYSKAEYWAERMRAFRLLLPALDGLVFLAESLPPGYAGLGIRYHYLPLVALPSAHPLERLPPDARDIDVFFSGYLTKHRVAVLEALHDEGLSVFRQTAQYPEYLRRHFLARSRLALGLRIEKDTEILSKQRAHYYLCNRIPHLFERTADQTDLHPYLQFADSGGAFIERAYQLASGLEEFPYSLFDAYRADPRFDPVAVFRAFLDFLDGPA